MNRKHHAKPVFLLALCATLAACGGATPPPANAPTSAAAANAAPAGATKAAAAQPTTAATGNRTPTPRPLPTAQPIPPTKLGQTLTVEGLKITASDLATFMPPDKTMWPIKDHYFVTFLLKYENGSALEVTANDALFTKLEDANGEHLNNPFALMTPNNPLQFQRRANLEKFNGRSPLTLKPGESRTITRTIEIPVSARQLIWRDALLFKRDAAAQVAKQVASGTGLPFDPVGIDLGAAPAPPPAAQPVNGTLNQFSDTDWGTRVMVKDAALYVEATDGPLKANLKPDEAMIRVGLAVGNPAKVGDKGRVDVQLQSVTIEEPGGRLVGPYLFVNDAKAPMFQGGAIAPQKQMEGNLFYIVKKATLGELKVRFHPDSGFGNVTVPVRIAN